MLVGAGIFRVTVPFTDAPLTTEDGDSVNESIAIAGVGLTVNPKVFSALLTLAVIETLVGAVTLLVEILNLTA